MKKSLALLILFGLCGCSTLQERLAKRVGCDPTKLVVNDQIKAPAFTQYKFNCEGKNYVCKDAPFYNSCNEDVGGGGRKK